jgi:hypothetical protein
MHREDSTVQYQAQNKSPTLLNQIILLRSTDGGRGEGVFPSLFAPYHEARPRPAKWAGYAQGNKNRSILVEGL